MQNKKNEKIENDAPGSEDMAGMNQDSTKDSEFSQELIGLLGEDRFRTLSTPPKIECARQLPIVTYAHRKWFLDLRLRQIRNVIDPDDFINLEKDEELVFLAAALLQSRPGQRKKWKII